MLIFTIILTVAFVLIFAAAITQFILIKILLNKQKTYEQWILTTRNSVQETLEFMRDIDKQGVFSSREVEQGIFESDDLVGQIFKQLTEIVEDLNKKIE